MKQSIQNKLANITTILWDFDSVFTQPDHRFFNLCDKSNPLAASRIIPNLDYKEAHRISAKAFKEHRDTLIGFMPFAEKHGIPKKKLQTDIFKEFHSILRKKIVKIYPELLAPQEDNIAKLKQLKEYVTHCIVTHSCAEKWAIPNLKDMNEYQFIKKDNHVIGYDQYGFNNKRISPEGILLGMKRTGAQPRNTVFVEDTLDNLQMAKATCPEITTAWITNSNETHEGVDIKVKKRGEFLDYVLEAKLQPTFTLNKLIRKFPSP